jgi:hypothetical protein
MTPRVKGRQQRAALVAAFLLVVVAAALFVGCATSSNTTDDGAWQSFRIECEVRNTAFWQEREGYLVKDRYVVFAQCARKIFRLPITSQFYDAIKRGDCVEYSGEALENGETRKAMLAIPCESQRPQPLPHGGVT